MSSVKGRNDPSAVHTVKAKPFSVGDKSGNPSKMYTSGKCKCIDISAATVRGHFDIIQKGIHKPIKQNDCAC